MDIYQEKGLMLHAEELLNKALYDFAMQGGSAPNPQDFIDTFEALLDKVYELEAQVETLDTERDELESKVWDKEEEIGTLESRVEQLVEDNDDLRSRLE
jgi:chromosome segregation ATPase